MLAEEGAAANREQVQAELCRMPVLGQTREWLVVAHDADINEGHAAPLAEYLTDSVARVAKKGALGIGGTTMLSSTSRFPPSVAGSGRLAGMSALGCRRHRLLLCRAKEIGESEDCCQDRAHTPLRLQKCYAQRDRGQSRTAHGSRDAEHGRDALACKRQQQMSVAS